ncbi:MAG: hypothetical protein HW420_1464 [Candidatus Nitrosotenuis sp.]|nr:hypothetical protein [Candidatus Nitrosotenuis sp.]
MATTSKQRARKGSPSSIKHDEFVQTLIERKRNKLDKLVKELAGKNNTTLNSILKVEDLFKEHIEFNSRSHLLRELKGSMKAPILNTIIVTWIDTKGNTKLNAQFNKAVPI